MTSEAARWKAQLGLEPHPEGGHYRETWRSPVRVAAAALPPGFAGERALASSILYLLAAGERSLLHRLRADEIWYHHAGGPLGLHLLHPDGQYRRLVLGPGAFQQVVPHDCWFAAEPEPGCDYALAGCFVSPGFDFADFQLGRRDELLARFPRHAELVLRFTAS